jgi:hypothetical protein
MKREQGRSSADRAASYRSPPGMGGGAAQHLVGNPAIVGPAAVLAGDVIAAIAA